jgi:hypothetical protein
MEWFKLKMCPPLITTTYNFFIVWCTSYLENTCISYNLEMDTCKLFQPFACKNNKTYKAAIFLNLITNGFLCYKFHKFQEFFCTYVAYFRFDPHKHYTSTTFFRQLTLWISMVIFFSFASSLSIVYWFNTFTFRIFPLAW